tara:strand:+ start:1166 stop:2455 length:1290 start_codon:yes stop_codon:yes gene_type:complete
MVKVVKGLKEAKKAISDIRFKQKELINDKSFANKVNNILSEVAQHGDKALIKYTKEYDHVELQNICISDELLKKSWENLDQSLKNSLTVSANRIKKFHEISKPKDWYDQKNKYGIKNIPLEKVGIYIPGGNAPLLSTVLMTVIPAKVAGVSEIYICTPPSFNGKPHPSILAACYLAKVDKVYSIGGAQSIASLAYGTDTIPKVDMICGPGNRWVTEAKRQVFGTVGIDGLYGPTESFVIGDNSSKPEFCAVDFVSQAEHDISSVPLFCTDSEQLIQKVQNLIPNYLNIKNKSIAETVIKNNGLLILIENINDSAELVNTFAPEHVSIMTNNNDELLSLLKNVGVIFLGHYSHHVLGDYIAGPSHTMPTGGTAKFSSGVGINTFMKHVPYVNIDKEESIELSKLASIIGKAEFMDGHSNSALERIKKQAE